MNTPPSSAEYNVYCDESRHTSDPADRYLVIGAICCPRSRKRDLVNTIHHLEKRYKAQGEFGWKRLSHNKRDFYWELLHLFLSDDDVRFRCIVADRQALDHERFNEGDSELGFYKLYYQMLVHWLQPGHEYHIYLDSQQNKMQNRFSDLKLILQRKLSGRARILCLEPVNSGRQPLLQLTDLLIGAVGYAWNERAGSMTKLAFCRDLADGLHQQKLNISTPPYAKKWNVFNFIGSRGG